MKEGVDSIFANDGLVLLGDFADCLGVARSPVGFNSLLKDDSSKGVNVWGDVISNDNLEHQDAETLARFHFFQTIFSSF